MARTLLLSLTLGLLVVAPAYADDAAAAKKVLEKTKPVAGLFTVHVGEGKAILEVTRLKRPFLLATSISGGPTYAGFQWADTVAEFRKEGDQLLLLEKEVRFRIKNRNKPIAEAVTRTYTDRLIARVPILALKGRNPLVDLKRLFGTNAVKIFGAIASRFDSGVVMVNKVKAFPSNVEIALTIPDKRRGGRLTQLAYSLSELRRGSGFRPRLADDRVGYFLTAVKDFSDETAGGDRFVRFVNRWNLRKADPSLAKSPVAQPVVFYIEKTVPFRYRQAVREGILAWNEAFAECGLLGALVVRQQTKTEFNELDPEDVRYNFFRWIVSERAFAMGPSRVNPMTGQILDADIIFDESMVRSYLREYDLAIRQAPRSFLSPEVQRLLKANPKHFPRSADLFLNMSKEEGASKRPDGPWDAPKATHCGLGEGVGHQLGMGALALGLSQDALRSGKKFPQSFLDQIVKDVVMHEVGHTLGLRHNFTASTWRDLSEINSKKRPADVCASVMDYNPINVVSNPKKGQGHYTMQGLGPYDVWAIRFGYHPSEGEARKGIANVGSAQFAYATDEDTRGPDPYVARWDLGSDPLAYSRDRMALVKRLLPEAVKRSVSKGQSYRDARRAVDMLLFDYQSAALAAARFVGGQRASRHHMGDKGAREPLVPVDVKKQRQALGLICKSVLEEDALTLPPELLRKLGKGYWSHWGSTDSRQAHSYGYHDRMLGIQSWALYMVTNPATLGRILDTEAKSDEEDDRLTVPELFTTVSTAIFGKVLTPREIEGKGTALKPLISTVQRNLQRHYVGRLIGITLEGENGPTPAPARQLARLESKLILNAVKATLEREPAHPDQFTIDPYTRGHLEEIQGRLERALSANYRLGR